MPRAFIRINMVYLHVAVPNCSESNCHTSGEATVEQDAC